MHRGLWNMDHAYIMFFLESYASFFSEATLIEIGVYEHKLTLRWENK